MRLVGVGLAAALLVAGPAAAQGSGAAPLPAAPCAGGTTLVQRGDTLSVIAARCDVSERVILAANPGVEGSGDLRVGGTVNVRQSDNSGQKISDRLNNFASDANEALGRVAGTVGSSVQDLLDKNPDLKSRLESFGSRIGLSSGEAAASLAVSPQSGAPGSTVTVSATGLPKASPVRIGAGPPGSAYDILQDTRTSPSGTLDVHVQVPEWLSPGSPVVFVVVNAEGAVEARSGRFALAR